MACLVRERMLRSRQLRVGCVLCEVAGGFCAAVYVVVGVGGGVGDWAREYTFHPGAGAPRAQRRDWHLGLRGQRVAAG